MAHITHELARALLRRHLRLAWFSLSPLGLALALTEAIDPYTLHIPPDVRAYVYVYIYMHIQ